MCTLFLNIPSTWLTYSSYSSKHYNENSSFIILWSFWYYRYSKFYTNLKLETFSFLIFHVLDINIPPKMSILLKFPKITSARHISVTWALCWLAYNLSIFYTLQLESCEFVAWKRLFERARIRTFLLVSYQMVPLMWTGFRCDLLSFL